MCRGKTPSLTTISAKSSIPWEGRRKPLFTGLKLPDYAGKEKTGLLLSHQLASRHCDEFERACPGKYAVTQDFRPVVAGSRIGYTFSASEQ